MAMSRLTEWGWGLVVEGRGSLMDPVEKGTKLAELPLLYKPSPTEASPL